MTNQKRVAIISGVRTPFVKAGTSFKSYSMQDLGKHVVAALVSRSGIDPKNIDEFIFGAVLLDPRTPNWAREILYSAGLPNTIYAHSVSNNCISGLVAITNLADRIALGLCECGIAGGSESMSNPTLTFSRQSSKIFMELFAARSFTDKLRSIAKLRPTFFLPNPPSVTEPSTGLTMGEHMEITAKEFKISRQAQDEIAFASHKNAHRGTEEGILTAEIEPLAGIKKDTIIRPDTTLEKLASLRPVFDRSLQGTLTAGNSSALTDGASAVLLMSEERASQEGKEPLAFITSYQFAAIDPKDGLLMAPAVAVPKLLARLGLKLSDFDLIEIHEAFGAQVMANIQAWETGWKEPSIGNIDKDKLNVLGGSIAIGHPFAATGARILTTLANQLKRNNLKRGLISICAAGAMAGAMVIERH